MISRGRSRGRQINPLQGWIQGGGGGAKGAEAPPPLQVNEMCNIHFGQNTNSHLSETSEK